LAAAYARVTTGNVCNAAYERPALRAALGDVEELAVLDAGCAAGENAAWLVEHGAHVVALDASAAMIDLARARLGAAAQLVRADLEQRLPFGDRSFDLVVSSLTLHYVRDWAPVLREFARVLRRPGWLVLTTHHPLLTADQVDDYFGVTLVREQWTDFGAQPVPVQFYHRPLQRITDDLHGAGFRIRRLEEIRPTADAAARNPQLAARLRTRPGFLLVDAVPSADR